ncbi:hypothetical protein BJ165DRAFT_659923 [Panaeolus papilionaceus]|nr:hypothetical protein BJ165DRAFT_659923 [Panaeolus papilionaceus]
MDVAQGETLDKLESDVDPTMRGFDALSTAEQIAVTKSLAKLKAALSKPVPFNKIGSLTFDNISGEIVVGPLTQLSLGKLRGGPFESVEALWRSYIEETMIMAMEKWPQRLKYDAVPVQTIALDRCSPQKFSEFAQIVSALVQQFKIPSAYRTLVLHHPDLAFRNIFFDKQSLSTGEAKITGVIDWAGAKILPILLSAQFPEPLMTSCDYPYEAIPGEYWFSVPHDWTCLGDTSKWPKKYSPGVVGCWDLTPSMTNAIRKFYLRGYFGTRYAEQLDVMGDRNISHATIFSDAPFYLKFHEAISSGWRGWLLQEKWIRETYWRLKALPVRDDESLVLGPNVYWSTFRPNVLDLRDFEEVREPDDLATGWEDADSNSEGEEE